MEKKIRKSTVIKANKAKEFVNSKKNKGKAVQDYCNVTELNRATVYRYLSL